MSYGNGSNSPYVLLGSDFNFNPVTRFNIKITFTSMHALKIYNDILKKANTLQNYLH